MVILSYILLCQKDWQDAQVTICYVGGDEQASDTESYLKKLIESSRFQIGSLLYRRFDFDPAVGIYKTIIDNSQEADLLFLGLSERTDIVEYMTHWDGLNIDAVFLRSNGDANLQA